MGEHKECPKHYIRCIEHDKETISNIAAESIIYTAKFTSNISLLPYPSFLPINFYPNLQLCLLFSIYQLKPSSRQCDPSPKPLPKTHSQGCQNERSNNNSNAELT